MKKDLVSYDNFVGYKLKLNPTEEQKEILNKYFGLRRFVYNLGIDILKDEKQKLSYYDLRKLITRLKKEDSKYKWLCNFDSEAVSLALNDAFNAFKYYRNEKMVNTIPTYKSKKKSKKQFAIRSDRLDINDTYIRIPSIGNINYYYYNANLKGSGNKDRITTKYLHFSDARIRYTNNEYYLTFDLPKDEDHQINSYWNYADNKQWQKQENSKAIGIDFGLRKEKWMVDSAGYTVERPDNSKYIKKISFLNKKLNRQYKINKNREPRLFKDRKSPKNGQSKNMQKTKAKINKYYKKITDRRRNEVYNYCNRLLDLKPKAIVMESIFVHELQMHEYDDCVLHKNKMNNLIKDAAVYDSMRIIERKMMSNGIPVIYADDQYPSSQLCSNCGHRQNIGRKETYICPECGTVINRDYNAALNLAKLANLICPIKRLS